MNRIIRPIGKVSAVLKRHGYRQQAAIIVDGEQLPHTAILSKLVDKKIKFEGHYIDPNGELHKTGMFVDMKRAATSIMKIRDAVLAAIEADKPVDAEPTAAEKRAARRGMSAAKKPAPRRPARQRTSEEGSALIDCKGCGTIHRDDTMCPW